jgi:hypothetical protein
MADSLFPMTVTTIHHGERVITRQNAVTLVSREYDRGPYSREMIEKLSDECLLQELGTEASALQWRFAQLADGKRLDFVKFVEQMWKEYHESK